MARTKLEVIYPFLAEIKMPRCLVVLASNNVSGVYLLNSEKEIKNAIGKVFAALDHMNLFNFMMDGYSLDNLNDTDRQLVLDIIGAYDLSKTEENNINARAFVLMNIGQFMPSDSPVKWCFDTVCEPEHVEKVAKSKAAPIAEAAPESVVNDSPIEAIEESIVQTEPIVETIMSEEPAEAVI